HFWGVANSVAGTQAESLLPTALPVFQSHVLEFPKSPDTACAARWARAGTARHRCRIPRLAGVRIFLVPGTDQIMCWSQAAPTAIHIAQNRFYQERAGPNSRR